MVSTYIPVTLVTISNSNRYIVKQASYPSDSSFVSLLLYKRENHCYPAGSFKGSDRSYSCDIYHSREPRPPSRIFNMSSTSSALPPNTIVDLQVGERRFTTRVSTLCEGSSYFASLFSDRWQDSRSDNGSYFVDADPDIFAHILCYLRRGVLPLLYRQGQGFDHAFYQTLQGEALYFGVEPLYKWIKEKGYLQAVTIQYSMKEVKGQEMFMGSYTNAVDGDTEQSFYPSWTTEQVYQCPRGIPVHTGNAEACGRACERAKGEDGDTYIEQNMLRTVIVAKKVIFNPTE